MEQNFYSISDGCLEEFNDASAVTVLPTAYQRQFEMWKSNCINQCDFLNLAKKPVLNNVSSFDLHFINKQQRNALFKIYPLDLHNLPWFILLFLKLT